MLTTTKDALGRDITSGDGMRFIDVGRKSKKTGARIITDYETVNGAIGTPGTDHYTSIYFVRMDPGHSQPWQFAPLFLRKMKVGCLAVSSIKPRLNGQLAI